MLVIGHRGCSYDEGENTISGITSAIEAGVDGIEVDLRLSEERVILLHDSTVTRTTNGFGHHKNYPFNHLRQLICKNGDKIPCLEEALPVLLKTQNIYLEVKELAAFDRAWPWLETALSQPSNIFISCTNESLLLRLKYFCGIRRALIANRNEPDLVSRCLLLNCSQLHISFQVINERIVSEAKENNIKVLAFTVNSTEDLRQCQSLGIDGIFTDLPREIMRALYKS